MDIPPHTVDGVEFQVSGYLIVDVWDHDSMNPDDFLGMVMIPLRDVPTLAPQEEWYPLTRRTTKEKVSGSILLELHLRVDKNKVQSSWKFCGTLILELQIFCWQIPLY